MIRHRGQTFVTPQEGATMLAIRLVTVYQWARAGLLTLLDQSEVDQPLPSKYLIELSSLREQHQRSYLGTKVS